MAHRFIGLIVKRDGATSNSPTNHTMMTLLIVLLVLLLTAVIMAGALVFLRRRRRAQKEQQQLPMYDEKRLSSASTASNHRRILIRPSESVHIYDEKRGFAKEIDSPPDSPLPEIRVTFPEEYDASGKRTSGRVVVVHVSDTGVGLERAETLPTYQQTEGERFHSVDLDRVGGLVEKARNPSSSFD